MSEAGRVAVLTGSAMETPEDGVVRTKVAVPEAGAWLKTLISSVSVPSKVPSSTLQETTSGRSGGGERRLRERHTFSLPHP